MPDRRSSASFDVVDELTAEHGVAKGELVPVLRVVIEANAGAMRLGRDPF